MAAAAVGWACVPRYCNTASTCAAAGTTPTISSYVWEPRHLMSVSAECGEQWSAGRFWLVSLREVGAEVAGGLGRDLEIAHVGAAGEGEAGDQSDAHPGADEG